MVAKPAAKASTIWGPPLLQTKGIGIHPKRQDIAIQAEGARQRRGRGRANGSDEGGPSEPLVHPANPKLKSKSPPMEATLDKAVFDCYLTRTVPHQNANRHGRRVPSFVRPCQSYHNRRSNHSSTNACENHPRHPPHLVGKPRGFVVRFHR